MSTASTPALAKPERQRKDWSCDYCGNRAEKENPCLECNEHLCRKCCAEQGNDCASTNEDNVNHIYMSASAH